MWKVMKKQYNAKANSKGNYLRSSVQIAVQDKHWQDTEMKDVKETLSAVGELIDEIDMQYSDLSEGD
jgi:beta-N-acetylglucosaminidase